MTSLPAPASTSCFLGTRIPELIPPTKAFRYASSFQIPYQKSRKQLSTISTLILSRRVLRLSIRRFRRLNSLRQELFPRFPKKDPIVLRIGSSFRDLVTLPSKRGRCLPLHRTLNFSPSFHHQFSSEQSLPYLSSWFRHQNNQAGFFFCTFCFESGRSRHCRSLISATRISRVQPRFHKLARREIPSTHQASRSKQLPTSSSQPRNLGKGISSKRSVSVCRTPKLAGKLGRRQVFSASFPEDLRQRHRGLEKTPGSPFYWNDAAYLATVNSFLVDDLRTFRRKSK